MVIKRHTAATDADACASSGILVNWDANPDGNWGDDGGTHTYEVMRDGSSMQSGIAYGTTELTDDTATSDADHLYTVRYWNCGGLFSETTGATGTDNDNSPNTPDAPIVTDANPCAQTGVWISWSTVPETTEYDLRIDGTTVITGVTSPYLHDPGDTASHTYEARATNPDCAGEWSAATAYGDGDDGLFCDGFENGDTTAWSSTLP